jgi:hypothetical protein
VYPSSIGVAPAGITDSTEIPVLLLFTFAKSLRLGMGSPVGTIGMNPPSNPPNGIIAGENADVLEEEAFLALAS